MQTAKNVATRRLASTQGRVTVQPTRGAEQEAGAAGGARVHAHRVPHHAPDALAPLLCATVKNPQ